MEQKEKAKKEGRNRPRDCHAINYSKEVGVVLFADYKYIMQAIWVQEKHQPDKIDENFVPFFVGFRCNPFIVIQLRRLFET